MSATEPTPQEIVDRGLVHIEGGIEDLASWQEDFRKIFEIVDREAGENVAVVAVEEKLFKTINAAMDCLIEYRTLRLRDH